MYPRMNPCPIRMYAYENKTLHMLDRTADVGPACVLGILITESKTVFYKILGTPVAGQC
jgi:hypothetical protein